MKLKTTTATDIFLDESKALLGLNKIPLDSKWYKVKDIIVYLDKEMEWYQNEYNKAKPGTEEYLQRLHELRLLKRIRGELK